MVDPKIQLYDAVRIKGLRQPHVFGSDRFNMREPRVGDMAYVIEIYEDPPGYELECSGENGITEWLLAFTPEEVELEKVAGSANG